MKKTIIIFLVAFSLFGKAQGSFVKFTQIQKTSPAVAGSVVISGTNGALTYTPTFPASVIPTLSAYVPYSGASGSLDLGSQSFSTSGQSTFSNVILNGVGITPTLAGGTGTSSRINYLSTTGTGTSNAIGHRFLVGNNGSITPFDIYNDGNMVMGSSIFRNYATSGANTNFFFAPPNETAQTASTEKNTFLLNANTIEFATGNKSVQRSFLSPGATLTAVGSSTFTDVYNGYFRSNTIGANLTAGNNWALGVEGNLKTTGTHSLGNANLTGGSSGTVAVLSDAIFQITFFHSSSSPGDAATLYFGNSGYPYWAVNHSTVNIPMNCTLIGWDYNIVCNSVIGTGEASTLTIAGTTTAALSTGITFSAPSAYNAFSATGLSVDFNANDKINARLVTPTWATNPTALIGGLTLYFRRRS